MKAYVTTSGLIFSLIVLAHLWRLSVEGLHPATEPVFVAATLIAAALAVWAWSLLRRPKR